MRHSKFVFDKNGRVIDVLKHKNFEEICEEKDRQRSARLRERKEARRQKIRNGQEVNLQETLDGYSSANSINSYAGVAGTDTRKVEEYQKNQDKKIWENQKFENGIKNHKAVQPFIKVKYLKQFQHENEKKLEKMAEFDEQAENQKILENFAKNDQQFLGAMNFRREIEELDEIKK